MGNNNQVLESTNQVVKSRSRSTAKKYKWREIESIKDKFQLEKDLRAFEGSLEHLLEDFMLMLLN